MLFYANTKMLGTKTKMPNKPVSAEKPVDFAIQSVSSCTNK